MSDSEDTKSDNCQISKEQDLKKKMNKYRRDYYRNKYNSDDEYKKKKQRLSRIAYSRKTITCSKCKKRWNYTLLEKIQFEFNKEDKENFVCPECKNEVNKQKQLKNKRGRPHKGNKEETNTQTIIL